MKNTILFLLVVFGSSLFNQATAQDKENIWRTLALIKYEKQYSENDGVGNQGGRFMPIIKKLEGEEVIVKGYIIPLSGKKEQSHFMFSAYPYANCFFCGKAGPESVMEVFTKDDKKIAYSDDPIKIKGIFHLLPFYDANDVMFILKEAEIVTD